MLGGRLSSDDLDGARLGLALPRPPPPLCPPEALCTPARAPHATLDRALCLQQLVLSTCLPSPTRPARSRLCPRSIRPPRRRSTAAMQGPPLASHRSVHPLVDLARPSRTPARSSSPTSLDPDPCAKPRADDSDPPHVDPPPIAPRTSAHGDPGGHGGGVEAGMGKGAPAPTRSQRALNALKRHGAFVGPGVIASVAYLDPGNWSTDLAAGSQVRPPPRPASASPGFLRPVLALTPSPSLACSSATATSSSSSSRASSPSSSSSCRPGSAACPTMVRRLVLSLWRALPLPACRSHPRAGRT